MASLLLNNTAKAILLALLGTGLLSACGGGGGGTVRNPDNGNGETPTPETTYKLSISSPVTLQNVNVKVITLTNKEIGQGSISKGTTLTLDVKASDVNQILIAEISPKNNSSTYYDPALNASAIFDTKLRRVFIMTAGAKTVSVDPFSEIAYQRMLVRSGQLDKTNPEIRNILSSDIDTSREEVLVTFGVDIPGESTPISKRSDYEKLDFTTIKPDSPNTKLQYANAFFSLGHYLIQKNENPSDKTPYLTFAKRAAEDMRDGSLDGRTLIGDGTDGKVNSDILKNPIIGPAPLNTNPAFNVIRTYNAAKPAEDNSNNPDTIKGNQRVTREAYATLWKNNIASFLSLLPNTIDQLGKTSLLAFNYAEGLGGPTGDFTMRTFGLHSFGAGNYKRAFGIEPVKIAKDTQQWLLDKNCKGAYVSAPADESPVLPGCIIGINIAGDQVEAPYNTIQALVGQYTSVESCKLSIDYKGNIKLSKGDQVYTPPVLSPSEFLSIINVGTSDTDQSYVLNVTDGGDSSGTYVQLKIVNQKITSATVGVSANANNKFPKELINQKLHCTFQYS